MLMDILSELFRPPYDMIQILTIILIALFGLYTCAVVVFSIHRYLMNQKIRRFFSAHKPTSGVITKYEAVDGDTYVSVSAAVPGQLALLVPRIHKTPDQYVVVLECHTANAHFYAEYQIPRSDYKEQNVGETIQIKDSWEPVGFESI